MFSELWWVLGKLLHEVDHGRGTWQRLDRDQRKRALGEHAEELRETTDMLRALPGMRMEALVDEDVTRALDSVIDAEARLEPNDALHLAVMSRLAIGGVVTNDHDLRAVTAGTAITFNVPDRYVPDTTRGRT